jgi:LCP family protein required for cell wall assembly
MADELRAVLEAASTRGRPAGAEVVLDRAEREVRPKGRRAVRAGIGVAAAAAVLAAALIGGGSLYARNKLDDIDRVDLAPALAGTAVPAEPMNVLLVGSDRRDALPLAGARADTIIVAHLDPAARTASLLSLPRDLWVPIDGGADQRINTASAHGAEALVRTVQDALGIRLDHYVQLDFEGFRRLVDAVGGIRVAFDVPVRDRVSGLDEAAGCRVIDGETALRLVRGRHVQRLVGGRWLTDPTGDLGRIATQQRFVVSALAKAGEARSPRAVLRLLDAAADHLTVDAGLSSDELVALGRQLADLDPAAVRTVVLPVTNARVGSAAVLDADPAALLAAGRALTDPAAAVGGPTTTGAPVVTLRDACDE